MPKEIKLYFTPRQTEALDKLLSDGVNDLLYGGAKGGGKSVFGVQFCFLQCQRLIQLFGIKEDPGVIIPVGYMGRKRGVDFTKTTLETWKKIIPPHLYKIRPLDKEIIVDGKVKLYYGGMDDESSVNKMNSAEFAFIFIDQAEEISKDDLGLLKGTLRLRYNNRIPKYKTLLTANPAPSFLKYDYIDAPPKDGSKIFVQALPTDNPFLDEGYIATLTDAFKHRPELIRAYVHGSWDDIEGLDILIKSLWLEKCVDKQSRSTKDRRVTSADVARFGHDETVIYNMVDNVIVEENISGVNTAETNAARILRMAKGNNSDLIVVDGDGFGGGVVDVLRKLLSGYEKPRLLEINSGRKAQREDMYANFKTELWFHASNLIAEGKVGIPRDNVLFTDLTSVKYTTVENGRFKVDNKKDVKKRISRSPDRADAAVYGWWGTQFIHKNVTEFNRNNINYKPSKTGGYGWEELPGRHENAGKGYGWL